MADLGNGNIRRLQRKLIPVNFIVCILSAIAAVSLFFAPLIKIDLGKVVTEESIETFKPMIEEQFKGNFQPPAEAGDLDMEEVLDSVTQSVLYSLKGEIVISPRFFADLAFSPDPGQKIVETYISGEDSLVNKMIDDVDKSVKGAIEDVVIDTLTVKLVENLSDEVKDKLDTEALNTAFRSLGEAENREQAENAANNYLETLKNQEGLELSEENENVIRDKILEAYDKASAEAASKGEEYSMETLVCVVISEAMNAGFDPGTVASVTVAGKAASARDGSGEGGSDNVYTNYDDLISAIAGQEDFDIKKMVSEMVGGMTGQVSTAITDNKVILYAVFGAMAAFSGIWLILFLFAFFHMFAKNKRFTMWYVKLFGFIPCLIFFVAPLVAPVIITNFFPALIPAEFSWAPATLGAISSMTWISGVCYIALWLISIFWAFPIKRKIRRLKKENDY